MKKPRQFRIDVELLERFDRINQALAANGSEVVRRLIQKYVEEKEKEAMVSVEETIEFKENFPIDGEAYTVGQAENGQYFFAWGPEYPFSEKIPGYDIPDGESGIRWYETKEEALQEYLDAIDAIDATY